MKERLFHITGFKLILLIFLLSFTIYFNTLGNDFLFDDQHLIINNTYIKYLKLIPRIFSTDFFHFAQLHPVSYYRPIPLLTHALEYKIWKLNPFGYHLTNISLHALNSYLVYHLIFLLFANPNLSLLSSILFCLHPIHSTTVSLIFNRGDLLLLFFGTSSIINYLLFIRSSKIRNYLSSIICFSLAVFTKENAVLLLPLLFLCLCYAGLKRNKINLTYLLPFLLVYLIYLYLRLVLLKMPFPQYATYGLYHFNFFFSFLNFLNIVVHYLKLLILPFGLYYHHGVSPIITLSNKAILIFAFCVFMAVLFIWLIKNKKKLISFSVVWFTLGIVYIIKTMYTFGFYQLAMMEHWVYLSSIGFFIVIGDIFNRLFKRFAAISVLLFICLSLSWSILTCYYNYFGKDKIIFYQHILKHSPGNADARFNLASAFLDLRNLEEAEKQIKISLAIEPYAWDTYLLWGNLVKEKGDLAKAAQLYNQVLIFNPGSTEAINNLGLIYKMQGAEKEAIAAFEKAIAINPGAVSAMQNLADVLIGKGLYNEALALCDKILKLNPGDISAHVKIGIILAESGHPQKSELFFREALRLDQNSVEALRNLGVLYANSGDLNKAMSIWEKVLIIKPGDEGTRKNIERAKTIQKNQDIKR